MNRETRKANLKKIQLPSTTGNKRKRNTRQSARFTATTNNEIKNYFLTPEKHNPVEETTNIANKTSDEFNKHKDTQQLNGINLKTSPCKRAKRTKLDAFIFKDPNNISDCIQNVRKSLNDDDFILPEKKIKKAPKLNTAGSQAKTSKASSKRKKQTTIKSAFFRNEQLFSEIAAQHCAADQFDGDDIQLALAISKSEADSKNVDDVDNENVIDDEVNLGNNNDAESIRKKLKKFGFRTAEREDYNTFAAAFLPKVNSRRTKSKWANKFTPLTLRSAENQLNKLQQTIETLLNSQFRTKPLNDHANLIVGYQLQSSLLKKSEAHEHKKILQTTENVNQQNELYFVTDLFEISNLPAGHLLKDWTAIQGRDLTPNRRNKKTNERLKILENIYQDLEEYFICRKTLDWTTNGGNDQENKQKILKTGNEKLKQVENNSNVAKIVGKIENVKPAEIEDLKQSDNVTGSANTETNIFDLSGDKQILQLLPTVKSLDMMQVSSCDINTQATTNTTQKNRSNSPDLFADSDAEMEETDKHNEAGDKTEVETVINIVAKDKKSISSLKDADSDITTYEIYSSDEVKNTLLSDLNKSPPKELPSKTYRHASLEKVIDLTQDNIHCSANNRSSNTTQIKAIVEIDLFAESPPQDDSSDIDTAFSNINSQTAFKFSFSMETNDYKQHIIEKKVEHTFQLSSSPKIQEQLNKVTLYTNDDDIVLSELAADQSTPSFINFQDSRFHQKTITKEKDKKSDKLAGNDTEYRELWNKYLNQEETATVSTKSKQRKTVFEKSFSQILPALKTPQKCDNFQNFTLDSETTFKRKSMSFTAKTPLKMRANNVTKNILSKSQSFNNNKSFKSNIRDDNNDVLEIVDEEDDDCLLLSDDEINYSIWQANKTETFQTSEQSDLGNVTPTESHSDCLDDEEHIVEFPYNDNKNKEFSYLELKDKEKSLIKIALGAEESLSDFEILTSKYTNVTNILIPDEPKFDCTEYGILEEYSQTDINTHTKVLTEASFLSSPTETAAPMKRFSCQRSSQKFKDLLNNIEAKSPPNSIDTFNDFDQFDHLAYTSPLKSGKANQKPQDFDRLLTGEIRYKASQKRPETTPNKFLKSLENPTQEIKYNDKIYTVRYTYSPKPDYTKYTEAELLKQLYNYGIKPLKRKQAVKMLEYIYNQTHPILMEAEEDKVEQQQDDVIILDDFEGPSTSKQLISTKKLCNNINNFSLTDNENFFDTASHKLNLQDSCGLEMLRYCNDLKAELLDENYILQTNVTKKTLQPLLPFHIAWYNLVCSNKILHEKILIYEPIDLQEIYLFLKTLGYRYDPKDLKEFFDRRCIVFRYDLTRIAGGSNGNMNVKNSRLRKTKK